MDQLEEIKRRVDIVDFIGGYISLKRAGRNFKALCPFHSEKTPSFIVSPERQIWHCFGACNEGGDIFKFLMKMENIEFGEALRELAKRAGVKLTSYKPSEGERQKQLLYEINHLASEYFHYLLLNHHAGKTALNYILGRGIKRECLEIFKLGYAPNSWDSLQRYLVGKKNYRPEDLESAGLIIKREQPSPLAYGRYYDRFRHRLIFPLTDHRGNIRGFAGRLLDQNAKEAKYINTPETPVYHKSELLYGLSVTAGEIKKTDEAILVEGELDLISSFQAGVKNVVAIKGTALTEKQISLIGRFTKNIVFALDSDIAGDQAARRGIEMADQADMSLRAVEIRGGKDPDEIAQKDPEGWRQMVKKAVPVYDYFFDSAFSRFDASTAEGKRKIGGELIPVLAKISNEIVRDHYIVQLVKRLGVSREAVEAQIAKIRKTVGRGGKVETMIAEEKNSKNCREALEEYLFALALQSGKWEGLLPKNLGRLIKTTRLQRIREKLVEYTEEIKSGPFKSEELAARLPPELVEGFNYLYVIHTGELIDNPELWEKEYSLVLARLKEIDLRERLEEINREIERLETKGNAKEKIGQLEDEFRKITVALSKLTRENDKIGQQ